jgi:hypothetical protein
MAEEATMTVMLTGGCQCGAVRYALTAMPEGAHFCHCRMCQKAVGGPFAALVPVVSYQHPDHDTPAGWTALRH